MTTQNVIDRPYSITPTATTISSWDANKNLSAVNMIDGFTTTVTSASPVTLVVGSNQQQFFTGSTAQTLNMPVASTLVTGMSWYIVNQSSAVTTVQSSGGNTIIAMAANTTAVVTCIVNSGTDQTSWFAEYEQSQLVLPLSLANGGTNAALTASNGGIFYSSGSAGAILSGTATARKALLSQSNSAPIWSTETYAAPGTSGNVMTSDGTNWTSSGAATVGAWADISGSISLTGFSGSPTITYARAVAIGKTYFFTISVTGTSNSTAFTITGMPKTANSAAAGLIGTSTNGGTINNTPSVWQIAASGTTLSLGNPQSLTGWQNSSTKGAIFTGFYETT
jgi:hypothetical protein